MKGSSVDFLSLVRLLFSVLNVIRNRFETKCIYNAVIVAHPARERVSEHSTAQLPTATMTTTLSSCWETYLHVNLLYALCVCVCVRLCVHHGRGTYAGITCSGVCACVFSTRSIIFAELIACILCNNCFAIQCGIDSICIYSTLCKHDGAVAHTRLHRSSNAARRRHTREMNARES